MTGRPVVASSVSAVRNVALLASRPRTHATPRNRANEPAISADNKRLGRGGAVGDQCSGHEPSIGVLYALLDGCLLEAI